MSPKYHSNIKCLWFDLNSNFISSYWFWIYTVCFEKTLYKIQNTLNKGTLIFSELLLVSNSKFKEAQVLILSLPSIYPKYWWWCVEHTHLRTLLMTWFPDHPSVYNQQFNWTGYNFQQYIELYMTYTNQHLKVINNVDWMIR